MTNCNGTLSTIAIMTILKRWTRRTSFTFAATINFIQNFSNDFCIVTATFAFRTLDSVFSLSPVVSLFTLFTGRTGYSVTSWWSRYSLVTLSSVVALVSLVSLVSFQSSWTSYATWASYTLVSFWSNWPSHVSTSHRTCFRFAATFLSSFSKMLTQGLSIHTKRLVDHDAIRLVIGLHWFTDHKTRTGSTCGSILEFSFQGMRRYAHGLILVVGIIVILFTNGNARARATYTTTSITGMPFHHSVSVYTDFFAFWSTENSTRFTFSMRFPTVVTTSFRAFVGWTWT